MKKIEKFLNILKLLFITLSVGIVGGLTGSLFSHSISFVTSLREKHTWILYLMPLAGLCIIWLYKHFAKGTKGVETVLNAAQQNKEVPFSLGTNIFISTVLTHFVGGSAGREGAALQIGGSLGSAVGKALKISQTKRDIPVMCGMSAVFSALFGTPITATVFIAEVSSVGFLTPSAIIPCTISSFAAFFTAKYTGVQPERFAVTDIPGFTFKNFLFIILLGLLCSVLSYVFCLTFKGFEMLFEKTLKNEYLRILAVSLILIIAVNIFSPDYCGGSMWIIEDSLSGNISYEVFLLKLLFTAITIAGGFKGGEIVPALCVGSSFGCVFGILTGLSPSLCAASSMIALFAGVTNCPLAAMILSCEMLGGSGFFYTVIAVLITFVLSRYCGIFKSKKLPFKK